MSGQEIGFIVILIILILLSASFSAAETAFSSLNAIRLKQMAKAGDKKAKQAYKISKNFTETITTILIGNNIVNILATSLTTSLFSTLFGAYGVAIATVVMTILILLFGEIIPKILAKSYAERMALYFAKPLSILSFVLKPITMIIVKVQTTWEKKMNVEHITATEGEFLEILSTIEQEGVLEQEEREMIESVIEFDDKLIREVMVPSEKVIFVYDYSTFADLKELLRVHKLSRIPVLDSKTLEVIGIIRVRDVLDLLLNDKVVVLADIMQKPIYISQRRRLPQVLDEIQRSREHMAVVVESMKSNRFVGIVTLEDLLEELVGEIYDEYDHIPKNVVEIGHHTFHVEGSMSLYEFFNEFIEDQAVPNTKARTVAEWILEINNGKKVRKNKVIEHENFTITILETELGMAKQIEIDVGSISMDDEI